MRPLRIGLDVGSRGVRVVWIESSRPGGVVWHHDQRHRRPTDSPAQLIHTLRELLRPLRFYRFDVPVYVAMTHSHVRQLTLKLASVKQIPAVLPEHLPALFPFEQARIRFQHRLVAQRPVDGKLACTVQLAACDRETLRQELGALWALGWMPSHAYPAAHAFLALANAEGQGTDGARLLIEFGARHSTLAIAAGGELVFARDVALGSDYLTEALMSQPGESGTPSLSWEQAERLKCQVGIPDAGEAPLSLEGGLSLAMYQAFIQPVLEQWVREIQRTITFSAQTNPEAVPQRVVLCGGGSQLVGLDRWLSAKLGMPVERLSLGAQLGEDLPAFAVACGLLLADGSSRPSLLFEHAVRARRVVRAERVVMKTLALALIGLLLGLGAVTFKRDAIRRRIAPLEQRWLALEPVRTLTNTVTAYTDLLATLTNAQGMPVAWFKELAREFPNPVRLTDLSVNQHGEVRMVGQAQAREQSPEAYVSDLAMWLERAHLCQGAHLDASERNAQHPELVDFTLTCKRL